MKGVPFGLRKEVKEKETANLRGHDYDTGLLSLSFLMLGSRLRTRALMQGTSSL